MTNTVVGLLDRRDEAEEVVDDLVSEGFDRKNIHIVANDRELAAMPPTVGVPGKEKESGFHSLMVKLGFLEDRRRELGWPAEDVDYYSEGVRRGGVLVTVDAESAEVDRAMEILEDHGAVDIQERAQQWRQAGWTAPTVTDTDITATTTGRTATGQTSEQARIPVVEEELKVGKRAVGKGGVRVFSHVTETPVSETVTLREEHVNVERRPVDRPLTGADTGAFRENTLELTETAEEAVVSKEARVVEEVVVSKDVTEHSETVKDTVRRTDVEVEPVPPSGKPKGKRP